MIKLIRTLIRGRVFEAEEAFIDSHAELLLAQQIRDAASAIQAARRAVAVATAQNEQEKSRHATIVGRIADLEARTLAALEKGNDALAREAAETIAHLEAERETSAAAQAQFDNAIVKLKGVVRGAETRLQELQRGERLARATGEVQKLGNLAGEVGLSSLYEAEETLGRLRHRQEQNEIAAAVLKDMDGTKNAATIIEKLANAGCGAPLRTSADDVLARLRSRMPSAQ